MSKKSLPKLNEKLMFQILSKHDTYFADTFNKDAVNIMCNNIDNDFPLLINTGFVHLNKDEIELIKDGLRRIQQELGSFNFIVKEKIDAIMKKL